MPPTSPSPKAWTSGLWRVSARERRQIPAGTERFFEAVFGAQRETRQEPEWRLDEGSGEGGIIPA